MDEDIDEHIDTDPDEADHHPIVDDEAGMSDKMDESKNIDVAAYDSRFFARQREEIKA